MKHHFEHRTGMAAIGLVALVALTGCGSDEKGSSSTAAPQAPAESVAAGGTALAPAGTGGELTIKGLAFSELTTKAGAEISISNQDGFSHTVTAKDGSFDVPVSGGSTETLTIPTAGTYEIFCKIHSSMHGTITVE